MSLKGNIVDSSKGKSGGIKSRALKRLNKYSSSDDDSDREVNLKKYGKCQTRNAVIARMNRIKKKNYIMDIENNLAHYKSECENMKGTLSMQTTMIQTLRNEIQYLKNVLANSKEISVLVKSVRDRTGLPTISSLKPVIKVDPRLSDSITRDIDLNSVALPLADDDDYLLPSSENNSSISDFLSEVGGEESSNGDALLDTAELQCNVGICLHIAQKRISLEFCSLCNSKSSSAWENLAA